MAGTSTTVRNLPFIRQTGRWQQRIAANNLRKMNEPRIHFAIVCASIGCPRLLNEAYVAQKLEQQLATNSTDFFSRSRNLQFDQASNQLKLSSIMQWFGSDFGPDSGSQIQAVKKYFPASVQNSIGRGNVSVSHLEYDWNN